MNHQLKSQSTSQFLNFDDLIDFLKNKVTAELTTQETKKNFQERTIKINNIIYKFIGQTKNVSLFITMGIVLGLFLIGGGAVFQSYEIFHSLKIAADIRKLTSIILFFSGLASAGLGITSIYNFRSIFNVVGTVFDAIIVYPLAKIFSKSNNKANHKIYNYSHKISYLKETLKSLDKMKDNFKYLIHSSLKDKIFTQKDAELIYKHLTSNNIPALIHLLYHDKISDIKYLSVEEKQQLSMNLEQRIQTIKNYVEEAQNETLQSDNQSIDNKRHRRVERLHTYQHDNMITETFSDIPMTSHKGRK